MDLTEKELKKMLKAATKEGRWVRIIPKRGPATSVRITGFTVLDPVRGVLSPGYFELFLETGNGDGHRITSENINDIYME